MLRAIVQTGSYELDNLGDRAMLEVMIDRVREHYPETEFSVFARDAERVRSLDRNVRQIPVEQKREWAIIHAAYLKFRRAVPVADSIFRKGTPSWYQSVLRLKARALVNSEALSGADILIVSGGGFITDVFPGQVWPVFERMAAAIRQGVPFVLLSQGIGPLRDPALVEKAREVLPFARLIAIRENLYTHPLLKALGVSPDRIVLTGDDAIEPAYLARSKDQGTMLGVNFRVAEYAGISQADVDGLGAAIRSIVVKLNTSLVPLPVCIVDSVESASDAAVDSHLIDPATAIAIGQIPATPAALIQRVTRCRVVVTGSYHAAVFALAQGIPAICVFNTAYYGNKFRGLESEFGDGCEVIDKSQPHLEQKLIAAIENVWHRADELRPSLLRASVRQISAGHDAYARLSTIIDSMRNATKSQTAGLVA